MDTEWERMKSQDFIRSKEKDENEAVLKIIEILDKIYLQNNKLIKKRPKT